jgi:hypothetical protein
MADNRQALLVGEIKGDFGRFWVESPSKMK